MISWNIEGWCERSLNAKEELLYKLNADVVLCVETWACDSGTIRLNGYQSFEKIRPTKHVRAERASGGMIVLIKSNLLQYYSAIQIFCEKEEIIHVQLKDKITDFTINLVGTYIPPDNSSYAQNNDAIFEQLVGMMYELCEDDLTVITEDINGRVGNNIDFIEGIDELPNRVSIHDVLNDQGRSLLGFLRHTNMCIVNGRVNPLQDNFTSISHKGRAVVDYVLVPHLQLKHIDNFSVNIISDLTDRLNITRSATQISDHSVLKYSIKVTHIDVESDADISEPEAGLANGPEMAEPVNSKYSKPPQKFKKKKTARTSHDIK